MTTLLLVGATGLVGRHVLDRALLDSRVDSVVALTRRPVEPHERLQNPIMSFDRLDPDRSWWSADAVVCTLGTTIRQAGSQEAFRRVDFDYPLAVARIARERGCSAFVLNSSVGASPSARSFYLRVKGEVEDAIGALGFPSYTIVRPSGLVGKRSEFRLGERLMIGIGTLARPVIPARYRLVNADDVAASLLEAAIEARAGRRVIENEQI